MNKGELIAGMAEESGVSKADAEKVLERIPIPGRESVVRGR